MTAHFQLCLFVAAAVCSVYGSKVQGADISKIIDSCYDYLEQHLCEGRKWGKPFHFYRPSVEKYTADQWLWDSGAHMIVWSQKNVNNAVLDMRTMLQMQQPDGRIPEQIYWSDRTAKEDAELLLMYSNTQFTGQHQMLFVSRSLTSTLSHSPKYLFCHTRHNADARASVLAARHLPGQRRQGAPEGVPIPAGQLL